MADESRAGGWRVELTGCDGCHVVAWSCDDVVAASLGGSRLMLVCRTDREKVTIVGETAVNAAPYLLRIQREDGTGWQAWWVSVANIEVAAAGHGEVKQ